MAQVRGADVTPQTFTTYTRKLDSWPSEEIYQACQNLGRRPRGEGEPAFPSLGIIVNELQALTASNVRKSDADRNMEEIEQFFWDWIDFQMEETGLSEQQILNTVQQPGFEGRRAGTRPPKIYFCEDCEGIGMRRIKQGPKTFVRHCVTCDGRGRAA